MTRRVYLYFTLTFLLGVIIGASGVFFFAWHTGHWHRSSSRNRFVSHLKGELNLSEAQVQQLTQIMEESAKRFADLQKQSAPQFHAVREETRNRIRQILTPDQAAKFDEIVRRWEGKRKHGSP